MEKREKYAKGRLFLFFCLFFVCFSNILFSQKEPQYTQYMYNVGSFNSAYVGSTKTPEIIALYRAQWAGVEGAPRTIRAGVGFPMKNEKNGLGFNIIHDELGPSGQTIFNAAYSYQLQVSDDVKLSFGVNGGGSLLNVDFTKGDFEFENEPLLNGKQINQFYPIIGAGTFLYSENWYVGFSVPNLLTSTLYNDEVAVVEEGKQQFNFIGGIVFDVNEQLKFKPALMLNYISQSPISVNFSGNFLINDLVTAGLSYRLDNAVSALAGFQISNELFLGYSYDYSTNAFASYNDGSHELILKYYIGKIGSRNRTKKMKDNKNPKQVDTPRFF